ncbi:MAG TPA: glycosyltransferase family 9 protein [Thermoanaerobaculia bacterium]|nr:glycosyltransferase family 9 protein [Thermoanaerobaculia bacterium]
MPKIDARRICLVRLSSIGDAVHALALANGLRRGYPDAEITWVLERVPHDVVRHQQAIDRFIVFDARAGIGAWSTLVRELSREPFDLVIIPQVSSKAALVAMATRGRVKLGFDRGRSREIHALAINQRIDPGPLAHAQDLFLEFLDWLDLSGEPEWNLRFTAEEEERSSDFFSRIGMPVLSLVVASAHHEKDWLLERYIHLVDAAAERFDLQPVLVGGPSRREREIAETILAGSRSKPILALDNPIRDTLWKLRGSAVVVSPDTGPLHAAVAMNRPTIGLYGHTDPLRTGPYRKFRDLVVDKFRLAGEEDEPITRRTKRGRMSLITVDDVLAKIERALNR